MNIEKQEKFSLISQINKTTITTEIESITNIFEKFKNDNVVIDLSEIDSIEKKDLKQLEKLAKIHSKNKKSFVVLISKSFDFNTAPDLLNIVPTIQEVYDIIEMEEIERDLGF